MGHLNPHMILGVLSLLEAGLTMNKIPHRSGGVTAANNFMLKMIKKWLKIIFYNASLREEEK